MAVTATAVTSTVATPQVQMATPADASVSSVGHAGQAAASPSLAVVADPTLAPNQAFRFAYRAWNGARRHAVVLLPAGYSAGGDQALPCVIAAHGRDMPPEVVAQRWGELPTDLGFAVVCADSAGIREAYNSWAAPGQVRDLLRMPALVERALPWVIIDRRRIFAVGVSMGAQEVLCLAARYPDRLAGAAAFDGVTDLAARYGEALLSARGGPGVLRQMRHEMGGTPQQVPFAYRQRSPLSYAATLATGGLPIQLWWSPNDRRVINQATTQTGALYRRICRACPAHQVIEVETDLAHGVAFAAGKGFEQMLAGFRQNDQWTVSRTTPPSDWTYVGSLREARFWGYAVRLTGSPRSLWRLRFVGAGEVRVQSRVALTLSVPYPGAPRQVLVTVNDKQRPLVTVNGTCTVPVPAGSSTVLLEPAPERAP
jgi:poly(3-hydroxybutyrate) depolymerase